MRLVLTLVAGGPAPRLDPELIEDCRGALVEAGARPGEQHWLDPERACDLAFDGADARDAETAVRDRLGDRAVDLTVQAFEGRRKKLLVADMDATIVVGETLDELAACAGLGERIAGITRRAMAGELDFSAALRERVAMLAGLPESAIADTLAGLRLTPGARTLVQTMKAGGAHALLISGGFLPFTERARALAGFDSARGNRLVVRDGRLTGEVEEPILGREAKLAALQAAARELALDLGETCCVGDGANDLPMITAAGLGVAFHGKPAVRAAAGARVDHGDLTALLYFQGYDRGSFRE